jgi:hypothetical protein
MRTRGLESESRGPAKQVRATLSRHSSLIHWSGRADSNRGPLAPKISQTILNPCVSTAPSAKTPPKSGGFVPICSQNAPSDREAIRRQVDGFAQRLARRFSQAFADGNGTDTKKQVIGWMRAALPPHAGRPRDPSVTLAWCLRRKGVPWREIYPQCIEKLAALKWRKRRQKIRRLRNAYRGRRRLACNRRRKNPSLIPHAENN